MIAPSLINIAASHPIRLTISCSDAKVSFVFGDHFSTFPSIFHGNEFISQSSVLTSDK